MDGNKGETDHKTEPIDYSLPELSLSYEQIVAFSPQLDNLKDILYACVCFWRYENFRWLKASRSFC